MDPLPVVVGFAAGLAIFLGYWFKVRTAQKTADNILEDARRECERLKDEERVKFQQELKERREEVEKNLDAKRSDNEGIERRLTKKEDSLDRKFDLLNKKESYLETKSALPSVLQDPK